MGKNIVRVRGVYMIGRPGLGLEKALPDEMGPGNLVEVQAGVGDNGRPKLGWEGTSLGREGSWLHVEGQD